MKAADVKELAKLHEIKVGRIKKADIIRAIQTAEGNEDCFARGKSSVCGQVGCLWREDCQ